MVSRFADSWNRADDSAGIPEWLPLANKVEHMGDAVLLVQLVKAE
jgi:hypothetical protein